MMDLYDFASDIRYGLGVPDEATRESMYRDWCAANRLDPEDPESMIAYEDGWANVMHPEEER